MAAVTDPKDTRVLIPRVRRALGSEDAGFSGSAAALEYSDEEINAKIADAIAEIILYSGGNSVFGFTLVVADRDEHYMAPIAWTTEPEMTQEAQAVIAIQAALSDIYRTLSGVTVKETIKDEGQEWSYDLGTTVLTERIKGLRADRDRALDALARSSYVTDDYVNFLAIRDSYTDSLIEPWAYPGGASGGQVRDPRGFL